MKTILSFVFCLLFLGCQIIATTKSINLPGKGTANAVINKTKSNGNDYFVYGELSIENLQEEIKSINLSCFYLENNQIISKGIYVDSIAYILPYKHPIKNGSAKVDVYWSLKQPAKIDKEFSLIFNHPPDQSPPCLTFKP